MAGEAGSSAALQASQSDVESARATVRQAEFDFERARKNFEAKITEMADKKSKEIMEQ